MHNVVCVSLIFYYFNTGRQANDPSDIILGWRIAAGVGLRTRVLVRRATIGARDGATAAR